MDINAPPRLYLSPCYAFVVGAVQSHVASEDDTWVEGIHIEHPNPDTIDVRAAVSAGRAPRWDLNPRRPAVHRLIEVMVGVARSQKVKCRADRAQTIP